MQKIGVVSNSSETIERIIANGQDLFPTASATFVSFVYQRPEEVKALFLKQKANMDGWIFSGPNPYHFAEPYMDEHDNAVFCPVTGIEVYKYLLECLYQREDKKLRISIDMPTPILYYYQMALDEVDIPQDEIQYCKYSLPPDVEMVTQTHLKRWRAGEVDTILTTLQDVYQRIYAMKAPVRRIVPSTVGIRSVIEILREKMNGAQLKKSQVGLIILECNDVSALTDKLENSYQFQLFDLKVRERLLKLCQMIDGCYLSGTGGERYEIFASRGLIEDNIQVIGHVLEDIQLHLGVTMAAGIGFGTTAFNAQSHAYRAIHYGKGRQGAAQIVVVDADGRITEQAGTTAALQYDSYLDDAALLERLGVANVGVKTYQKLLAIVRHMDWQEFTAAQLAAQLEVTERNARRILSGLARTGLVACAGKEALSMRGRPTQKYQLVQ